MTLPLTFSRRASTAALAMSCPPSGVAVREDGQPRRADYEPALPIALGGRSRRVGRTGHGSAVEDRFEWIRPPAGTGYGAAATEGERMIVIVGAETLVLALLALLVAGLLRSHARILQALHAMGVDPEALGARGHTAAPAPETPVRFTLPRLSMSGVGGGHAFNVAGMSPTGEALSVAVPGARVDTLIAFLSSGCGTCSGFWQAFRDGAADGLPDRTRLVVVTRGPGDESPAKLRNLAPADIPVILSSEAWEDYGVRGSPYFVYVHGPEAQVAGEGSAASWADVTSLFQDALDNAPNRRAA